jgi:chemotaxis methyl-accepting protein methylase
MSHISGIQLLRDRLGQKFLRVNESMWTRLPASVRATRVMRGYGAFLHSLVKRRSSRRQYHGTFFLRNRPELELIRVLASKKAPGSTLKIAVLACSNGAEAYSILWAIRSALPDLEIVLHAVDISQEIVEIAREGVYPLENQELIGSAIFERLTEQEIEAMFHRERGGLRVQPWIRKGTEWHVGDAGDPALRSRLGAMDIVVANKFLCHMKPSDAEECLRKIAHFVKPGGYLFVSGIDLDVRTKVALDLGWAPVRELLQEIHDGDPSVRRDWPWRYWGLEPFDRKRRDWNVRYASVFQLSADENVAENIQLAAMK